MAARLPKAAREYLEQLRKALGELSDAERAKILAQTRSRLAGLPRRGRRLEDIIAVLGPVEGYASRFARVEPERLQISSGHEFLVRILTWPTVAFAVLTAAVLLFSPGAPLAASLELDSLGSAGVSFGYIVGQWPNLQLLPAVLVVLVPAVFALTPMIVQGKPAAWLQVLGALVMTAVAILAGVGVGLLLLPSIVLLWSQVLVPPVMMRNSMGRPGWVWRVVGTAVALLALLPVVLSLISSGPLWALAIPALLLVPVVGHLLRWRWADIALIAVGLLTIGYAAIAAVLLTPVFLIGSWLFLVGHLGLAGNLWHRRSADLLALL